jgi:hypothetical protein
MKKPRAVELIVPPDEFGPPQTSRQAIASFILGICSFVLCLITAIPAIFLGIRGLLDIKSPKNNLSGAWMAISSIALGAFGAIVSISLRLSFVESAREGYRRAFCADNLKRIALAMRAYEQENGCFPPAATFDSTGKPLLSWRVLLLPYLERGDLFSKFRLNEPWDSPHNKPLGELALAEFQCPSDPQPGILTNYQVIVDPDAIFTGKRAGAPIRDVTDGIGNTFLVVEAVQPVPWSKPEEITLSRIDDPAQRPGSNHAGNLSDLQTKLRIARTWLAEYERYHAVRRYSERLAAKYERAAMMPWFNVEPDFPVDQ